MTKSCEHGTLVVTTRCVTFEHVWMLDAMPMGPHLLFPPALELGKNAAGVFQKMLRLVGVSRSASDAYNHSVCQETAR